MLLHFAPAKCSVKQNTDFYNILHSSPTTQANRGAQHSHMSSIATHSCKSSVQFITSDIYRSKLATFLLQHLHVQSLGAACSHVAPVISSPMYCTCSP